MEFEFKESDSLYGMKEIEIIHNDIDATFIEKLNRELDELAMKESAAKNKSVGKKWDFGGFVNYLRGFLQNLHFPTFLMPLKIVLASILDLLE
jgi:hypothetical protein